MSNLSKIAASLAVGFVLGVAFMKSGAAEGPFLRAQNRPMPMGAGTLGRYQVFQGQWTNRPAFFMSDSASGTLYVWCDKSMGNFTPSTEGSWMPATAAGPGL